MAFVKCIRLYLVFLSLNIFVQISLSQGPVYPRRSDIESPVSNREDVGMLEERNSNVHDDSSSDRRQETDSYIHGWKAAGGNCSCATELTTLKRDLTSEIEERKALKKALDTYITELYDLRTLLHGNKSLLSQAPKSLPLTAKGVVSFSAKLSYNRELKPLDTVIFDTVLSNAGQAYDIDTGVFTAPLTGSYMFHATILSGYNTKVETAIIVNDKEVARIYSGAHDAHGSGSNMAILDLHGNDLVWVRLLYQGGNHIHGYYSTFSGALLAETEP